MDPHGQRGFLESVDRGEFTLARLRWLIALRWTAMAGVAVATALAAIGLYPGVAWPVMATVVFVGSVYNFALHRNHQHGLVPIGLRAAVTQAVIDLAMLTTVLWAAGGIETPFLGYYIFHVALFAILGGPGAALTAAAVAAFGAAFLALSDVVPALHIGRWDPAPPWDIVGDVVAFASTLAAATYIVIHAAREIRSREQALAQARDRAALEYQLLSNTLNELEAGLEVVEADGQVLWRNKRAEELSPWLRVGHAWQCPGETRTCEKDVLGVCPVARAREENLPGRCRFAAPFEGDERVYEMLSFPLATEPSADAGRAASSPRVMNLYVDRTQATLAERQLLLAERLASLGRVAQGVAHELNTPLATIRTLATDMRHALSALEPATKNGATSLVADLDESANLIRDETERLGRITQALLAGGDLVRARVDAAVPLAAVVERARALVVAGIRKGPHVTLDASVASVEVVADRDRLMQVVVNLLQNAVDAVRARGGEVVVRAEPQGAWVALVVEDDGPGLDPAVAGHLFEPFATTKPPGEGTGLGLYTSYMLVQAMGGELLLENREGGGARATVRLAAGERDVVLATALASAHRAPTP